MQQRGHNGFLGAFISALLCNLPHRVYSNLISESVRFPEDKKKRKKNHIEQVLEIWAGRGVLHSWAAAQPARAFGAQPLPHGCTSLGLGGFFCPVPLGI